MTDLQKKILDVLVEFQKLCEDNNLQYYAIGGTCLGAIRHSGFIPWDDDIDVIMPISDYNRLKILAKSNLNYPYSIYDFEEHKKCSFMYLKIQDTSTAFIEKDIINYPDRYMGVFIDVMPVAGWTHDSINSMKMFQLQWIKKMNACMRFGINEKRTLKSKAFQILTYPARARKNFNYYSVKYENLIASQDFGQSDYVIFPWRSPRRAIFPYHFFGEGIKVPFEDIEIVVPTKYDEYLCKDFGDYMELPPINERISNHTSQIIDLKKSYTEYSKGDI